MAKEINSDIIINGDIEANNLLTMAHTNSFTDLLNTPAEMNSTELMTKTFSDTFKVGHNHWENYSQGQWDERSSDRTFYVKINQSGYYPIALMGWFLSGGDSKYINIYCCDIVRKGKTLQGTPSKTAPEDCAEMQIGSLSGSNTSVTAHWTVLYRKV